MIKAIRGLTTVLLVASGVLVALALRDRVMGRGMQVAFSDLSDLPILEVPGSAADSFYLLTLDGNRRGPEDAPVTVVVFSNYGCSHCADFERTLKALLRRYPDQLSIVTKHFEPTARRVAVQVEAAADCAAAQGKFEAYHRAYLSIGQRTIAREPWLQIARGIGLPDSTAFVRCVRSGEFASMVMRQTAEAKGLGINAIPTSFVNGVMVVGDIPFNVMDELVAKALRGRLPANLSVPTAPTTSSD